jgi:adenylate cyclase
MGNAVNLAARLEGVNKQYNTGGVLISEYTYGKAGDDFACRRLDRVRVVGINTPLRLYELLYLKSEMDESMRNWLAEWEQAIDLLENRKFSEASNLFLKVKNLRPNDLVAELYLKRCASYVSQPPPPEWDAVNNLTEK